MKKVSNKKSKITLIFSLIGVILIAGLILSIFGGNKKKSTTIDETTATEISFSIDDDTYSALAEMTWAEWLESEYNTLELFADNENIVCSALGKLTRNENNVLSNYYVIENAEYEISISLINFVIDSVNYTAIENMTWTDWVASEYNTNNFFVNENEYVYHGNNLKVLSNNQNVLKTAQIISNANYTIEKEILQFTIDDDGEVTTYNFENGMTWGEWVASEYNTCGAIIANDDRSVCIVTQENSYPLIYVYQPKPNMEATVNYNYSQQLIVARAYLLYKVSSQSGGGGGN